MVQKTVKGQLQRHCYSASIEALKWETIKEGIIEVKKYPKHCLLLKLDFKLKLSQQQYKTDCRFHLPFLEGLINFKLKTS